MKDALKILKNNYCGAGGSFLFLLHERDTFDREEFCRLVNCIDELEKRRDFSRGTAEMIRWVHLQAVLHITYNFNPADGYVIKGLPEDIFDLIEDFNGVADKYFNGFTKIKD